jgi:Ca-activated chloride channel family protein
MVAIYFALIVMSLMLVAEQLHAIRCRRIARLAFGPGEKPAGWTRSAPLLRVLATGLLSWGLLTLLLIDPKIHSREEIDPKEMKNLILVLDVSPSMLLKDAGAEKKLTRRLRASELMVSMFNRMPMRQYQISLIAFYNGAKPLLEQSNDIEIIQHIIEDMPTYIGFPAGKTDLFAGLTMAAKMAKDWRPGSTTVVVVTDGVTVPSTGMPRMPNSVGHVLVVGVGDPVTGKFIDGHQSRQDISNLRQIATRLKGVYHDGNSKHVPSVVINSMIGGGGKASWWDFTKRELALLAVLLGSLMLSVLPVALHYFGSHWKPGVKSQARPTQFTARFLVESMAIGRNATKPSANPSNGEPKREFQASREF